MYRFRNHAVVDEVLEFDPPLVGKVFRGELEGRRLSLDDTIGKILPDYPNANVASKVRSPVSAKAS